MNKKLFVLICSLILFQYINSECTPVTEGEGENQVVTSCSGTATDNTKKCALVNGACTEQLMTCAEYKADVTDEKICGKLTPGKGKVCKLDAAKKKCIEEDAPSNGSNNLKYSLALLIFLFLF